MIVSTNGEIYDSFSCFPLKRKELEAKIFFILPCKFFPISLLFLPVLWLVYTFNSQNIFSSDILSNCKLYAYIFKVYLFILLS